MPIRQPGVNGWEGINCTPGIIYIGKDSGFLNDILFFYAIGIVLESESYDVLLFLGYCGIDGNGYIVCPAL